MCSYVKHMACETYDISCTLWVSVANLWCHQKVSEGGAGTKKCPQDIPVVPLLIIRVICLPRWLRPGSGERPLIASVVGLT